MVQPPILPSFAVTLPLNVPAVALIVPLRYTLSAYRPYPESAPPKLESTMPDSCPSLTFVLLCLTLPEIPLVA